MKINGININTSNMLIALTRSHSPVWMKNVFI